jgi:hypothetical protein
MKIAVFCALGLLITVLLCAWAITRIRYRIGSRHVKVLLFGVCIRRLALANIESISKRRSTGWAEHWCSTLRSKHRLLVLRRRRGLIKNFMVTPKNRYIFRSDIERAMARVGNPLPSSESEPPDQTDTTLPQAKAP